jgi:hypothetical protein
MRHSLPRKGPEPLENSAVRPLHLLYIGLGPNTIRRYRYKTTTLFSARTNQYALLNSLTDRCMPVDIQRRFSTTHSISRSRRTTPCSRRFAADRSASQGQEARQRKLLLEPVGASAERAMTGSDLSHSERPAAGLSTRTPLVILPTGRCLRIVPETFSRRPPQTLRFRHSPVPGEVMAFDLKSIAPNDALCRPYTVCDRDGVGPKALKPSPSSISDIIAVHELPQIVKPPGA